MESFKVNSEVYSMIHKFSASNKTINKEERLGIEMLMAQDGLDAQEKQVLLALDNQVAFSISDGKHSTTLDPLTIKFPPRLPGEQARLDRQDPARREIYDTLTKAGLKESEIIATFTYLDQVGVQTKDMLELFRNQQAHGYGAEDTLAALQAYGVALESSGIADLPEPNKVYLRQVAQELKAGNYRIDAETKTEMDPGTTAQTEPRNDVIRYGSFSIGNPMHRAVLLHELVHASHDVEFNGKQQELGVSMGFSEMEAHLAEGLYLLHAKEKEEYFRPGDREKPVMAFAEAYRNHVRTQRAAEAAVPPDPLLDLQALQAYKAFSKTEDQFKVFLENIGYYQSFHTLKLADGISQK